MPKAVAGKTGMAAGAKKPAPSAKKSPPAAKKPAARKATAGTLRTSGAPSQAPAKPSRPAASPAGRKLKAGRANLGSRTPSKPLLRGELTTSLSIGQYYFRELLRPGENDLTILSPGRPRAIGDVIELTGRLLDEDGQPVNGALIEIWQANAYGRYRHPQESYDSPLDPNFQGFGRGLTDEAGRFRFVTIKPGPYPVPGAVDWWRPPHIHVLIMAAGLVRLATEMFFPNETLNRFDLILNGIPDPKDRRRLIAKQVAATPRAPAGATGFEFDIVLRGKAETPFMDKMA
ncbi:MAG: protocatechuate 3,4-dioxygenase subunit beta [Alphaproteobacteria bacterium]|nr:protocatechuate 3,4-dioxygenase subunit beta [Alphaproteobacteria bacterium]